MNDFIESLAVLGVFGLLVWVVWNAKRTIDLHTSDTLQTQAEFDQMNPGAALPANAGGIVGSVSDFFGGPYLGGPLTSTFNSAAGLSVPVFGVQASDGYTGERPQFDVRTGEPL